MIFHNYNQEDKELKILKNKEDPLLTSTDKVEFESYLWLDNYLYMIPPNFEDTSKHIVSMM